VDSDDALAKSKLLTEFYSWARSQLIHFTRLLFIRNQPIFVHEWSFTIIVARTRHPHQNAFGKPRDLQGRHNCYAQREAKSCNKFIGTETSAPALNRL